MLVRVGPQTRLAVPAHVVTRLLDDTMAILNTNTGAYYTTNEVGARLVELTGRGASLQEVAEAVAKEFDVTLEQVLTDLIGLAENLLDEGLVTVSSDGA
jgi:hypothetical protein